MRLSCLISLSALGLLIVGCSNSVTMSYENNDTNVSSAPLGQPIVTVANVNDARGVSSTWVGAIRSSYGFPIKVLESSRPVSDLVKVAFVDGLQFRRFTALTKPALTLEITINKLDCSQLIRREAHVHLIVNVMSLPIRRLVKSFPVTVDISSGSILTLDFGFFASAEDLMKVMNKALHNAVDRFLDNPEFRTIIKNAGRA